MIIKFLNNFIKIFVLYDKIKLETKFRLQKGKLCGKI